MDSEVLLFFEKHAGALPVFEKFRNQVMETMDGVCMKVQKTQISFYNRHMFACVSFLRVRKAKDMPPDYIVVTFGLKRYTFPFLYQSWDIITVSWNIPQGSMLLWKLIPADGRIMLLLHQKMRLTMSLWDG